MLRCRPARASAAVIAMLLLSGCNMVVLQPTGDVAVQQRDLLIIASALISLIVVPLIVAILFFAWKYRSSGAAEYAPEWHDSLRLTAVVWSGPLAIIIILASITWFSTHRLDPYRPLDRISADLPIGAGGKPLTVQVVALDWKWLFIYPEYGVASINELVAPVNAPIRFEITASSVMNSFFVPTLAGQIYAMPGMQTSLHAVANRPGTFEGFSANYSGAGFSRMRFRFLSLQDDRFTAWVDKVKAEGGRLDRDRYLTLARPSQNDPVRHFGSIDTDLFRAILNMCVDSADRCAGHMMHAHVGTTRPSLPRTLNQARPREAGLAPAMASIDDVPICRAPVEVIGDVSLPAGDAEFAALRRSRAE